MNWYEKKKGYTRSVPGQSNNMSTTRSRREAVGKVWKMTTCDDNGNEIILKTPPGMYEKVIYSPKEGKEVPYIDAAEVVFGPLVVQPEIAAVYARRMAEMDQLKVFADYMKDAFVPQIEAYYNTFVGRYMYFGWDGFLYSVKWTAADVVGYKAPWRDWADSKLGPLQDQGYNTFIASIAEAKANWAAIHEILNNPAAVPATYAVYNTRDGAHDVDVAQLEGGSLWIDCQRRAPIAMFENDNIADTEFIRNMKRSLYVDGIYDDIDSPQELVALAIGPGPPSIPPYSAIFWAGLKGIIENNGNNLYIIGTDSVVEIIYLGSSFPDGASINLSFVAGKEAGFIKYPPEVSNEVRYFLEGRVNKLLLNVGKPITFTGSVKARLSVVPTQFGAYITPVHGGTTGAITDYGGIKLSKGASYAQSFFFQFFGAALFPPTPITSAEKGPPLQTVLGRFARFAGLYYDHPIITGKNIYPLKGSCPVSDLTEVNAGVNARFVYVREVSGYDTWMIMRTDGASGDCEDFALTKMEWLLQRGWPISKLHLEAGRQVTISTYPVENVAVVDHMWLVAYTDSGGEYVLDIGADNLRTRAYMHSVYDVFQIYQNSGLTWKPSWGPVETISLIPCYEIDARVLTSESTIYGRHYKEVA